MIRVFDDTAHFCALALAGVLASHASLVRAETMFSFYLGSSHTASSDVHIRQPSTNSDATFHGVQWTTDSFSPPVYYGLRVSHFFGLGANWGTGLEFTHDKLYSNPSQVVQVTGTWNNAPVNEAAPMNKRVQLFNISHGMNLVAAMVYHRLHAFSGWLPGMGLRPYFGGGKTWYLLHAENVVNGQANTEATRRGGRGVQVLGGLQFGMMPMVRAFVEARYNTGTIEVDTAGGGRATTALKTTQLIVGVSVGP